MTNGEGPDKKSYFREILADARKAQNYSNVAKANEMTAAMRKGPAWGVSVSERKNTFHI